MEFENELSGAIYILVLAGVIIGFLSVVCYYLSSCFNDFNQMKAEDFRKSQEAEARDRELITQAKNHSIQYSEEFVKNLREKNKRDLEAEIDFDINLADSIVKTEVVYAD